MAYSATSHQGVFSFSSVCVFLRDGNYSKVELIFLTVSQEETQLAYFAKYQH